MDDKLITLEQAIDLSSEDVKSLYKEYMNPGLAQLVSLLKFDRKFVRAQGTSLWDDQGNKYLDFLGAYGSINLGHNPPEVMSALDKVADKANLLQAGLNGFAAVLAHNLAQIAPSGLKHTFFANSGAEAVEGALKLARIASGKTRFIYCEGGFHGKSFGALSVTGRSKYQTPFEPLLPGCEAVPFGDLDALEKKLQQGNVAAFIVEPIQGEGGVIVPPDGYLKGVRELCTKYDTLLILDEIQTGFGRTGKMFAAEHENITPDIMCLAKSLGGGVMPIGAFMSTAKVWNTAYGSTDKALLHTSTFGGNTRAATAGIASIQAIVEKQLSDKAAELGQHLIAGLTILADKYSMITEVRGRGLLIGVEFAKPKGLVNILSGGMAEKLSNEYLASLIAGELLNKHHIITAYTLNNPNVIRFEPPLIVTKAEIDQLLNALEDVFERNKSLISVGLSSAKTVLSSLFRK